MDKAQRVQAIKQAIESVPRNTNPSNYTPRERTPQDAPPVMDIGEAGGEENVVAPMFNGVHLEIYKYFDISPSLAQMGDVEKMKKVGQWALSKSKTIGQALRKIQQLDMKQGHRGVKSEKLLNIYNLIRLKEIR